MTKLSIVICVHNTNLDYFNSCLKSIFNSSNIEELEIIVIDDGSSVDYSKLLQNYPTIKYYKTEKQGTLGARLYGLSKCSSPYVTYCDSDDTMSFFYYEAMLKQSETTNDDIIINDWCFSNQSCKFYQRDFFSTENYKFSHEEVLPFYINNDDNSLCVLWNKIYKLDLMLKVKQEISKFNLRNFVYSEDVLMNYFAFKHALSVSNIHGGFYFYRIHNSQAGPTG